MAVKKDVIPSSSGAILENVWANFIGCSNLESRDEPDVFQTWNEMPMLDDNSSGDGVVNMLQRLPSLGRWISMGSEAWETILDEYAALPSNAENGYKTSNQKSESAESGDHVKKGTHETEKMVCLEETYANDQLDVVEFQDLGSDYLESLMSTL
ncbi:hypothetical protein ACET3Z_006631 [Daucus carota]